jgi:hypothetical protein
MSEMNLPDVSKERRHLGAASGALMRWSLAIGVAGVGLGSALTLGSAAGRKGFFFAWLLAFAYVLSLSLGSLFFVILQHLTRAGWSVVVRRLAEAAASTLPLMALLVVPVVAGMHDLYHWSHHDAVAHDAILQGKLPYLNPPFFLARCALYLAVWWLLARVFVGTSVAQDASGDVNLTVRLQKRAPPAMLAFALTVTFASIDLLMSLDPHWFSTIFGVYFFAGSVVACFALLVLLAWSLQGGGFLRHVITIEHYHDLGKLLFAFVVFWAYIGFSQYMLYWYANIPEETGWFLRRQTNGWGWVGLALVIGHFALPFVALLSRAPKRRPRLLAAAAVWMLVMHWVDLYWLVMPELRPSGALPRLGELAMTVGICGLWFAFGVWRVGQTSLIPERDPRLDESLAFENA